MKNQRTKFRIHGLILLVACLVWTSSCSLLPPRNPGATKEAAPSRTPLFIRSRIQQVNQKMKYVLLEYVNPLELDTVHTVFRQRKAVAQVRVSGPRQYKLIAADILEGVPEEGDEIIIRLPVAP